MVKIFRQLVKLKVIGNTSHGPWFRVWLKRAQHHLASIFFIIGAFIRHPKHRQLAEPFDGFGHNIEMLTSVQWHIDPSHAPNLMAPHASTVDHHIAGNMALCTVLGQPVNASDAPARARQPGGFDPLLNQGTVLTSALGQRQGNIGWITLPVFGQIDPRLNPF